MRRITFFDLKVGQPLNWDLFDQKGNLLLRAGNVLSMPSSVDRLLERGAYARLSDYQANPSLPGKVRSPLHVSSVAREVEGRTLLPTYPQMMEYLNQLRKINRSVGFAEKQSSLCQSIQELANSLLALYERSPSDMLAVVHLLREPRDYKLCHQMLGAVIALSIAPVFSLSKAKQHSLVCAALSRDLSLMEKEGAGVTQEDAGSDRLSTLMRQHPLLSSKILMVAGCKDEDWLQAVQYHHEALDGTGYPLGANGERISQLARLLAVADAYATQVVPGGAANPKLYGYAIRDIFKMEGHYDREVAAYLFKTLTLYPPGAAVRLHSGEVAVVKSASPLSLYSIFTKDGMPRLTPKLLESEDEGNGIVEAIFPEGYRAFPTIARTLWE